MELPADDKNEEPKRRRVGLVYDERMCKHSTPKGKSHLENPNRISAVWNKLMSAGIPQRCVVFKAKEVADKYIAAVHSDNHINLIKTISYESTAKQRNKLAEKYDSIYFNEGSSESAYLAAGSVVEAAEKVAKGELNSAFAIVRPTRTPHAGKNVHRLATAYTTIHEHGLFYPGGENGSHKMVGDGPGFDAAVGDPLGGCLVTPYGYSIMLKKRGKDCFGIEGDTNSTPYKSVLSCMEVLLEEEIFAESSDIYPFESTWQVIKAVRSCTK
ncbi:histone deacetylase 5 [Tanacetum coccineum]|uniref:Histone deacetylase 5 n=1 Tax=Tanacetum coccineum TaxID=301880 RepID=A0ABQ5DA83_9ASTR